MSIDEESAVTDRRRRDGGALLAALLLAVLAAVVAWNASQVGGISAYDKVGPRAFPFAVAAGLAILAVLTAASALRGSFPEREEVDGAAIDWVVAGLLVQILAIAGGLGFAIGTGLLFAMTARAFGRGPLVVTGPIGIVFALVLYLVFRLGLDLTLPNGALEHAAEPLARDGIARLVSEIERMTGPTVVTPIDGGPEAPAAIPGTTPAPEPAPTPADPTSANPTPSPSP